MSGPMTSSMTGLTTGGADHENWLSNRNFKSHDDTLAICYEARNLLNARPWKILSTGGEIGPTSSSKCKLALLTCTALGIPG